MTKKKGKPLTREDVLKAIEKNGGKAVHLDLSGKVFEEGIDLTRLNLSGIILKEATLIDAHFEGANLLAAHLEGANLTFSHFNGAKLYFTYLDGALLWAAQFSPDSELEGIHWGNYILSEEQDECWPTAVITYRRLKMWYTNAGMYDIAAEFYYREMEARRKFIQGQIYEQLKKRRIRNLLRFVFKHKDFGNWVRLSIYRLTCGYGEMWHRVAISAAVVILGFAAAYHFWGSFSSSSFWDTLYYSAASFTALGYGRWAPQPIGWAKYVGAFEAFTGVFMMALLLITFVRKMTR